jgi:glutathione synthase/RimK-type ligase-like ATP-grasp enzyme
LITSVKFMSVEADTIEEARELALQQSRKHFGEDFRGVDIVEAPKNYEI